LKPILILLNGEMPSPARVREFARRARRVFCADGGARHAARLGIEPRVVIGDMDSLPKPLPRWKGAVFLCDFSEERSDFEKALELAASSGVREAWVAGAVGGRLDHLLVNFSLAERFAPTLRVVFVDQGSAFLALPGRHALSCRAGDTVSIVPATPAASVLSRGLEFPLRGGPLRKGSRGLSNRARIPRPVVTLLRGKAWIICNHDGLATARKRG
jgi:thiamine pyrophosphokinase